MRMGYAVVNGLQGTGSGEKYDKLHACLKHFAVHSGPESERHSFDAADVSYRDLMETYLFAFENLVKTTDVKEVMCAYNSFEGDPCCGSDKLLIQFLRRDWGYKGIVVSDCGAINDFFVPGRHDAYPNDPASATAKAVLTGTDLECGSSYKALLDAVKQGKIKESDIDVSVTRLLKARFELGEMDDDSLVSWNSIPVSKLACDEHDAVALQMARETMTLLQNRGNVLPLAKEGKRYAVLGPNAADSTVLWGNYNGTPRKTVTVLEAIREKVGTRNVFYADPASSLLATPAGVDAYIFVGGISPRLEGEEMRVSYEGFAGGDRTSIELPAIQREMLKLLRKTGKPVIFVNMSGSAIALEPETQSCDAILQAWYGGQEGGQAVADVLFGDYNPAGRLPVTFYRNDAQLPDFHDYDMAGRTYRYLESKPLFPFGFGLSYTTFRYGDATLVRGKGKKNQMNMELKVPVTNAGPVDGDEVVQVYVKKVEDAGGPQRALRGFRRVSIPAGQTVEVSIPLTEMSFRTFNEKTGKMEATAGNYVIYYGKSSDPDDLKQVSVKL
jgi:beta-glucosidase